MRRETCTRNPILAARMSMTPGRVSLYTGITALAAVLTNRLFFTPFDSLALTQSRSDILAVITGATLVLYGVGKAEIADKKPAVELSGVDIRRGFENGDLVGREVEWAMDALIEAVPNVRSCAVVVDGVGRYLVGRFRGENVAVQVLDGGVVAGAIESGKRAYMADMKVVPVKETEFGFFPENCQVSAPFETKTRRRYGIER